LANSVGQSKFAVAPLILEGTTLNKLQLNDLVKLQMSDIKLSDIQLSRTGVFTLYAVDVKSFNRLLNDLPAILTTSNQPTAKIFVPRSIQRIKDTEKVAFVKRVDLEIPNDRISEALKENGLAVADVTRLTSREGNVPTRTVKVTFADAENRNTFIRTGLQVDSMHFVSESATQNTKPVQCYKCLKYNHVAKYCKAQEQVCARCGESHRLDQCKVPEDNVKCCNCNGKHLATSIECPKYKEHEKKAQSLVNQYATARTLATATPNIDNSSAFPPLRNSIQIHQQLMQDDIRKEIISSLSSQMEKIIEEITSRMLLSLHEKIEKLERIISPAISNPPTSHTPAEPTTMTTTTITTTTDAPSTSNRPTTSKQPAPVTKHTTTTQQQPAAKGKGKPKVAAPQVIDPDSSMSTDEDIGVLKHIQDKRRQRATTEAAAIDNTDPGKTAKRPHSSNGSQNTSMECCKDPKLSS